MPQRDPIEAPTAEATIPFDLGTGGPGAAGPGTAGLGVADNRGASRVVQADFGAAIGPVRTILVFKLDHFGDFIIAQPALRDLRAAYPDAHIRMVCGSWNIAGVRASGLVDEVRHFDYFAERPASWDGRAVDDLAVFDAAVAGRFDLAIDLRVDEDTRHLLARVDARLRCGVGSRTRFPLLDVALPGERSHGSCWSPAPVREAPVTFFASEQFASDLPVSGLLFQQGRFAELAAGGPVRGALMGLPAGPVEAAVGLSLRGFIPGLSGCSLTVELWRDDGEMVVRQVYGRMTLHRLARQEPVLAFDNPDSETCYELIIRAEGRPLAGLVRFTGVHVAACPAERGGRGKPLPARCPRVELHVGETLGLLVALIRQRTTALYPPAPERQGEAPLRVVVAPFSNSSTRDWPADYYAKLIGLVLELPGHEVVLVGTPAQADAAGRLARLVDDARLTNLVGQTSWADLSALLRDSGLVICNNSGVAHLAAALGAQVLAIYSGSHQVQEWGPRGPRSHAIMQMVPCSPCGYDNVTDCTHDHMCMRLITPAQVFERARTLLAA